MRILQLLGNTAFGGATLIVSQISQALRDEGHEVLIMANDHKTKTHFESLGFICDDIKHMGRSIHPYKDFMSVLSLRKYVAKKKIDVIHSHTTKGGIYSRILKLIQGSIRVVHTVHGYYLKMDGSFSDQVTLRIEKFLLKFADHTTFVNRYDFNLARKWSCNDGIHLIHNGVDLSRFKPAKTECRCVRDGNPLTIGISARIVHEKGYSEFIDLIEHFKDDKNVRFEILGEGPNEDHYKSLVSDIYDVNNVYNQDRVVFHGYTQNVLSVLCNWDVNILPSYREGLSISLLEAMAIGLPSVATAIRGNVEIIEDGISGLLFEPRNSADLIYQVERLINDIEFCKQISFNARRRIEECFNQQKMLEAYCSIFESIR